MTASAASPSVASSSSPTSATLAGAVSRLLPDAWASALGGGRHGFRAGAASGRKPRVVPLKFQTNHVRKQYRLKRAAPTWAEWFGARKSTLLVAGGALAAAGAALEIRRVVLAALGVDLVALLQCFTAQALSIRR